MQYRGQVKNSKFEKEESTLATEILLTLWIFSGKGDIYLKIKKL